jgi:hypothetical protein
MRTAGKGVWKFLLGVSVAAGLGCTVFVLVSSRPRTDWSLSRVVAVRDKWSGIDLGLGPRFVDTNADWLVGMRVRNPGRGMLWLGKAKVQLKAQGRWLGAEDVAWLQGRYVNPLSHEDVAVGMVPSGTEAVKLSLEYYQEPAPWPIYLFRFYACCAIWHSPRSFWEQLAVCLECRVVEPVYRWRFSRTKWPMRTVEFPLPSHLPTRAGLPQHEA